MRGARLRALLTAVTLVAPLAAACGGSNLPDAPPCVAPTATPVPQPSGRANPEFLYALAAANGVATLESLTASFRLDWPDRRFSSRSEFRSEFVAYAGASTCLANDLIALTPGPDSRYAAFDANFEPLLRAYVGVIAEGTKAVRTRNVSEYRDFHRHLDDSLLALTEAASSLRGRRGN